MLQVVKDLTVYVYDVSSMVYGVVTSMSSHDKNLIAKLLKDYSIKIVITMEICSYLA